MPGFRDSFSMVSDVESYRTSSNQVRNHEKAVEEPEEHSL